MSNKFWDITFTPSVKAAQEHYGSRGHYATSENGAAKNVRLTENEIEFIGGRDGFYMGSVGENGQPYVQFRGGEPGFLKVLDEKTLGFADFRGNLQYISTGNIRKNNPVALFLMDYANRQRLKILAEAEVRDAGEVPELIGKLENKGYKAKIERAIILRVRAFDWNCPQHITPRFTIEEVKRMNAPLYEYVESLEAQIRKLKGEN
jgi:predicted pyridoxine 5'-phosphate oxidase superfamily flavin-nucleotide-binding protein